MTEHFRTLAKLHTGVSPKYPFIHSPDPPAGAKHEE